MQRTSHGYDGGSPLISVFGGQLDVIDANQVAGIRKGPLVLTYTHAGVVVLFLFVLFAALLFAFADSAQHFVYRQFLVDDLERRFGFRGGTLKVKDGGAPYDVFGLVSVDPNGALGRAGWQAGDVPIGHMHDNYVYFHSLLRQACEAPSQSISTRQWRAGEFLWSHRFARRQIPCPDGNERSSK